MATQRSENLMSTVDLLIVSVVIVASSAIGFYFAWKSRKYRTTRDFLVASSNIGVVPLTLSALATAISPVILMAQPSEVYTNGFQVVLIGFCGCLGTLLSTFTVVPVYFRLNLSTTNEYLEYRFNRYLRIIQASLIIIQMLLQVAVLSHLIALVLSNASEISYWMSLVIICGVSAIYTSIGGFTAVIWTDVLQVIVIFVSMLVLVIKGTLDMGGITKVWNENYAGGRTTIIQASTEDNPNYSFWSIVIGGIFFGVSNALINQPFLQRQNANKTLLYAQVVGVTTYLIMAIVVFLTSWFGLVLYSRYRNCDPLLNKQVRSRDQLTSLFALEIFKDIDGLMGLYIAGILAAALSTISSYANGFVAVIMIDYVKPMLPKAKESTLTIVSKIIGLLFGIATIGATQLVASLGSMLQIVYMITGIAWGPSTGMFLLGFFFPWANEKGATAGYISGFCVGLWAAIGRFLYAPKQSIYTLPVSDSGCEANNTHDFFNRSLANVSYSFTEAVNRTLVTDLSFISSTESALQNKTAEDVFGLYLLAPMWYCPIGIGVALVVGILVSIFTGIEDLDAMNPGLISQIIWSILRRLPVECRKWLGFRSNKYLGDMKWEEFDNEARCIRQQEMEVLNIPS